MMGLYAGSETALVSVDKGFIDKSATEGNERAKIVRMLAGSDVRYDFGRYKHYARRNFTVGTNFVFDYY